MRGLSTIRLLPIAAALAATSAVAAPAYSVRISEFTNAVYELDCVARMRPCSRSAFAARRDAVDGHVGSPDEWRGLAQTVSPALAAASGPSAAYPTPATLAAATSPREDFALAALSSPTRDALSRRVRARMSGPSAERYLQIVDDTRARRAAAWPRTAIRLAGLRVGFDVLAGRTGLDREVERLRGFFGAPEAPPLQVHLISLPDGAAGSVATLQRDQAFIETRPGDSPADRLTAVLHELSHYWYAAAPDEVHEQLLAAAIEDGDPAALSLYNLFDEILATSIANGYIERRLVEAARFADYMAIPESFYADPEIDAASKAALPLIEEYVRAGRTLDREFATRLLALTSATLADRRLDLRLQLRTSVLLADEALLEAAVYSLRETQGAAAVFSETLHGEHTDRGCALHRFPQISGIVMLDSGDVGSIGWLADDATRTTLARLAHEHRRFVYGWRRTPRATVYFVVGDGATETLRGFGQLLATRQRFSGLAPGALPREPAGLSVPERHE
jgi:hypothetical protein